VKKEARVVVGWVVRFGGRYWTANWPYWKPKQCAAYRFQTRAQAKDVADIHGGRVVRLYVGHHPRRRCEVSASKKTLMRRASYFGGRKARSAHRRLWAMAWPVIFTPIDEGFKRAMRLRGMRRDRPVLLAGEYTRSTGAK